MMFHLSVDGFIEITPEYVSFFSREGAIFFLLVGVDSTTSSSGFWDCSFFWKTSVRFTFLPDMLHPHLVGYVCVKRVDFVGSFSPRLELLDGQSSVVGVNETDPMPDLAGGARDFIQLDGFSRLVGEISAGWYCVQNDVCRHFCEVNDING